MTICSPVIREEPGGEDRLLSRGHAREVWCAGVVFLDSSASDVLKLIDLLAVALFRPRSSDVLKNRFDDLKSRAILIERL